MLKTKPLSELLHQAISPSVSQAMLLTPSGSLLATDSSPVSAAAKKARTHAALAANIWNSYDRVARDGSIEACLLAKSTEAESALPPAAADDSSDNSSEDSRAQSPPPTPLESLTLEFTDNNLHIQLVQPGILLCLIGPTHASRQTSSNSSLHSNEAGEGGKGFEPGSLPSSTAGKSTVGGQGGSKPGTAGSASAKKSGGSQQAPVGSLGLMKTQAKALVGYLQKELKGFEPSDF